MGFFGLSLPLGTFAGIAVRVHFTFFIGAWYFLQSFGENVIFGLVVICIGYFFSILLHEFGHALATRYCDGEANEIIMWVFGGLALCRPVFHPTAALITTIAGPFVTLVLWGLFFTARHLMAMLPPSLISVDSVGYIFAFVYYMEMLNRTLLFFNLIPAYPMDGGRMLQELLWYRIGWERATQVAVAVSKLLAIVGMIIGFGGIWGGSWIGVLSLMVFFESSQQAMAQAASAIVQPFSLKERLKRRERKRAFFGGVTEAEKRDSQTGFHVCAICKRTERDSPELAFRVAADGQEYCLEHLPLRK